MIPKGVTVALAENRLVIRGPKGGLATSIPLHVRLQQVGGAACTLGVSVAI